MKQYDRYHKCRKDLYLLSLLNENNMVLKNTTLFLDLDQAVAELISHYDNNGVLMVVLCQDGYAGSEPNCRKALVGPNFFGCRLKYENR